MTPFPFSPSRLITHQDGGEYVVIPGPPNQVFAYRVSNRVGPFKTLLEAIMKLEKGEVR